MVVPDSDGEVKDEGLMKGEMKDRVLIMQEMKPKDTFELLPSQNIIEVTI